MAYVTCPEAGRLRRSTRDRGRRIHAEALLGIKRTRKDADKYGFEIQSYGGSRISLMTPTPDGGFKGITASVSSWPGGRTGKKGDGSLRFTGIHRCGTKNEGTA